MSITNNAIVRVCLELLRDVSPHPHGTNERPFVTAYQIWILLREPGHPMCEDLIREYGGAVGRGGGENVGPAQRIAQALGHSNQIDTHYLDTRYVRFDDIVPAGPDCGLFRLSENR